MTETTRLSKHMERTSHPMLDVLPHVARNSLYALRISTFDTGVDAANDECAVLALAHFYQAARHYGLVTSVWHDMEFVIAQHSTKRPFITKTRPTTDAYALLKHILLDLGVDVSSLQSLPRPPPREVVLAKAKKLSPTASAFRAAMVARKEADVKLGGSRGPLIDIVLTAKTEQARGANGPKGQHNSHFTPVELLATFKKELMSDEPRNNFDYINLSSFCLDLMLKIIRAGTRDMPEHELKGLSAGYEFMYVIIKSAADARAASRPVALSAFAKAAAVMQEALTTGDNANKFSKAAFAKSSGSIPKGKRPKFVGKDLEVEEAVESLTSLVPAASVGVSRQTIEIYDPSGSVDNFERLLLSASIAKLMPDGRNQFTYVLENGPA